MFTSYSNLPNDGPIFEKEDVDIKLKELSREDFVKWCASKVDKNRLGGHINGFNSDKFDLYLRKNISVYVETIK